MHDLSDKEFEVITLEYQLLQQRIAGYDTLIFRIKGWSIGIFSASVVAAILQNSFLVLIIPLLTTFIFWGLDALYKSFQILLTKRALKVEKVFSNKNLLHKIGICQITTSFYDRDRSLFGRISRVGENLFFFNVAALYLCKLAVLYLIGFLLLLAN